MIRQLLWKKNSDSKCKSNSFEQASIHEFGLEEIRGIPFGFKLSNKEHIPALDGLRGIACLLVLSGHFVVENKEAIPSFVFRTLSQYWSGVDLFFVLSGFVIFLSLTQLKERNLSAWKLLRLFATSRAFRLLPVYAMFLSVYFFLPLICPQLAHGELFRTSIPGYLYLFFGQSWYMAFCQRSGAGFVDASWSLCAEVFLYALSFLIICFALERNRMRAMEALIALSLASRLYIVLFTDNLLAAYLLPVCRMDGFMLGGLAAVLYSEGRLTPAIVRNAGRALPILFCVFVALSISAHHFAGGFSIVFSYPFYAVFYSVILVTVVGKPLAVLCKGPLRFIGTISYFIYLFHFPFVYWMKQTSNALHVGALLNLLMTLALTVGAAAVSWHLLEKRLIAAGKALNQRGMTGWKYGRKAECGNRTP